MRSSDQPRKKQPRRDALVRATIEIVAERGVAGVTHRAVTERAGVPLTSATYYFTSIDAMVTEALRWFAGDRAELLAGAVRAGVEEMSTFGSIISSVLNMVETMPNWERIAFYELLCNAARYPKSAQFAREAINEYTGLITDGLAAIGEDADPGLVRSLFTQEIGRSLLRLIDDDYGDQQWAYDSLHKLLAGHQLLTENPERVDELMRRELT